VILLRSLLFNIAFYLFTALMALVGLPMLLAPRRSAARFGRAWAAGVLKLLGWAPPTCRPGRPSSP
jgi:hypothetical protein